MPSPDQPDRVADLIDRLLADSGFRAEFRRDPVGVARRLELTGLAAELDLGGKALHTLEVRESRSSLAGVVMAAAAEGIGSADLARLAGDSGLDTEARAVVDRALSRPQLRVVPEGSDASPPTHEPGAAAPPPVEAPPETAGPAAARSLADDPRLGLPAEARALLTSGSVDPRLVDLLGSLVVRHELGVGALQPGAVEIVTVDGEHVSPRSLAARDLAGELTELTRGRATHVRTPWPIDAPGFAGDAPPDRIVLSLEGPSAGPTETMDDGGTGRGSAVFRAVSADDSRLAPRTIAFPVATQDEAPPDPGRVPLAEEAASPASEALDYPGDDAPREAVAAWMARRAEAAGLPAELPVMASLVESGLRNLAGGDRDSVGFFQMRTGIWDRGAYAGYTDDPELQLKWFIDHALAVKDKRVAGGDASFGSDPRSWGAWIADVERPAEQYRGRYQLRLDEAHALVATREARGDGLPAGDEPDALTPSSGAAAAVVAGDDVQALLRSPRLELPPGARSDLESGLLDPRLAAVLVRLLERHEIGLSVLKTGHDKFTSGGSISNHFYGRGLDIATVDGVPVNPANVGAREVAQELAALDQDLRPTEVGTPWPIGAPGFFSDAHHADHLHVAFDDPLPEGAALPPHEPAGDHGHDHDHDHDQSASAEPEGHEPELRRSAVFAAAPADAPPLDAVHRTLGDLEAVEEEQAHASEPHLAPGPQPSAAQVGVHPPVAPEDMENTNEGGHLHGSEFDVADPEGARGPEGPLHAGYDLFARGGATVRSPVAGTIVEVRASRGSTGQIFGGTVKVRGTDGRVWVFRHVDPADLELGVHVEAGGEIARVTAWRDGPSHAHIELWKTLEGGYAVANMEDPLAELEQAYSAGETGLPEHGHEHAPPSAEQVVAPEPAAAPTPAEDKEEGGGRRSAVFAAVPERKAAPRVRSTVQFLPAVDPEHPPGPGGVAAARPPSASGGGAASPSPLGGRAADVPEFPVEYPGDDAPREAVAAWMARRAEAAGLPAELPVMASLVESGLRNLAGGDRDSVGFFQMRTGIWDRGAYAGYTDDPELQLKWFIDHALAVKDERVAGGDASFGSDPRSWGAWIADVERPAEQYRGRYQLRLGAARALLGQDS